MYRCEMYHRACGWYPVGDVCRTRAEARREATIRNRGRVALGRRALPARVVTVPEGRTISRRTARI